MNSIIQQLFMIAPIRNALLAVDAGPPAVRDDYEDVTFYMSSTRQLLLVILSQNILYNIRKDSSKKVVDSKAIKLDILREVQMIFGNLAFSQNQYFTPSGFWKHFK